jgi:hypothetical protein
MGCRRNRAGAPVCCYESFGRAAGALNSTLATLRRAGTGALSRLVRSGRRDRTRFKNAMIGLPRPPIMPPLGAMVNENAPDTSRHRQRTVPGATTPATPEAGQKRVDQTATLGENAGGNRGLFARTSTFTGEARHVGRESILDSFDRLNAWSRGGQRAPHKPLLVMCALGRWNRREEGSIPLRDVDRDLTPMLTEFGLSEQLHGGTGFRELLLAHHGQPVRPPPNPNRRPAGQFLAWHHKEVFQGPARHLEPAPG